ncbi:MAG TPA: type II secretion system F family protein [Atribacteraceae bacterium]|nr:type II secretion system F family protein [Atribacteraceae bacterium]
MSTFTYRVRDTAGRISEGTIDALNEREAAVSLRERGFFITAIAEEKPSVLKREISFLSHSKKVSLQDLAMFARSVSTMLEAGVPLITALEGIARQTGHAGFSQTIKSIARRIENGLSLSLALAEYPKIFNRVFLGMVQSGEAGGNIDWALTRLADYLEWEKDLRDKVQSATYYPVILVVAMIAASLFMVYFVFPQFVVLFEGFNIDLPLPTVLLLSGMQFVNRHWYAIYGGLFGSAGTFYWYVNTEKGRGWWDRRRNRLPLFGELFQKLVISRFCWIMNGLLKSGMPMVQSLEVVSSAVGDYYLRDICLEVAEKIRQGRNLSQSINEYPFFPSIVSQMINVGEESGNLEMVMGKITELYDKEIGIFVGRLSTIIEPVLTVIIGVGVFLLALAFFLPIFEMAAGGIE